jgi:hypothetical protein
VVQLRTGKTGFRSFLHKMKVPEVDSANCTCGQEMTVTHVILRCPNWDRLRREEFKQHNTRSLKALLGTHKGAKAVARLTQRTGLLDQFQYADIGDNDEEEAIEDRTDRD